MNLTRDLSTWNAATLLAILPAEPERLFSGDAEQAKAEYRALVALWHPDRSAHADATAVFQHLNRLYAAALDKLGAGSWQTPGLLRLQARDGTEFRIRYRKEHPFELGRMLIGDGIVAYVIAAEHADLFQNALDAIDRLPCANAQMAAEVGRYLPEIVRHFATASDRVLVLRKTADLLLLRDVLAHCGGRMDARHVAWIVSNLLNLSCYLDYARLAHNAILADTWFVSPERHSGALLGGWWYAVPQGSRMSAAPTATLRYAPFEVTTRHCGDIRTDLELIRALGRELLGDASGLRLAGAKAAPPAMIDWLRLPAGDSPLHEYETWMRQVLPDSFGERRFVKLELTVDDLY